MKLRILNLSYNSISDEGAKAIAHALRYRINGALKELNLSRNRIGDMGGIYLSYMVESNKTLIKCNLSYNNMGEEVG